LGKMESEGRVGRYYTFGEAHLINEFEQVGGELAKRLVDGCWRRVSWEVAKSIG
jgi:hypothetical protein